MAFPVTRMLSFVLILLMAMTTYAGAEQTVLADPQPSFDEPRKIILQLSSSEPQKMNDILYNAVNLQKFYGMDNVRKIGRAHV